MSSTITTDTGRRARPQLRLLRAEHRQREEAQSPSAQTGPATVLIAGAHPDSRTTMLRQLRELLPEGTPFVEACETWEVVAQAQSSRLVVLTGDLCDLSKRGLMRVLSRRYPLLPVIAVGACTDDAGALRLGAASL